MFGVGMGSPGGLKSLNGWQVWGAATPSSKRNASISSATSVHDNSPQGDGNYRGNLNEGWTTSRSTSGNWEDVNASPQKNPSSQLDSHSSFSLLHARQRQTAALGAPRMDDRSPASKAAQYSPQRYDTGLGKDASRYSASTSPSKPGAYNSFPGQQTGGYDSLQTSSVVDNELALGLRGMAVEDDYGVGQQNGQYRQGAVAPGQGNGVSARGPPPMQQPRPPYNGYPGADYSAYYSNQPGREPYMDYQYGYGTADPSLYGSSNGTSPASLYPGVSPQTMHPSAGQQPGVFYDYAGQARYYPTQAMMYPPSHSPMMTPQLASASPATLSDKKRELQVCTSCVFRTVHI
ncbi:hypothetical protein PLICRDRAFT_110391 [Plicaturopsis crispa FD-325 SS-3]|nr:hypothetical protein PLICRDRAFT_110391 [Plicaturopsis crispa FD-325 SS-3]